MTTVSKSKKKTGRPIKPVKKEIRASVRFTRSEYFVIQQKAETAGMTTSQYMRQVAIYTIVTAKLTEEQWQALRKLIGMHNNINQIAKACHKEGVLSGMALFQGYRSEFDNILKTFRS